MGRRRHDGGPPAGSSAGPDAVERDLTLRYLLRVVRIGVQATYLVLVPVAAYPVVDPEAPVELPWLYGGSVALGLVAATVVAVLPWERMLAGRWPMAGFYLWSIGDIVLVSLLVVATGGIVSPLWAVYALTTLFFAAAYPSRGQAAMLAFTAVAYTAAVAVAAEGVLTHLGEVAVRLGVLTTLAVMGGFISSELTRQLATHVRRARASRRVAEAGAHIGTLEREAILDAAVDAAADLGFPVCAVVLLEGKTYKVAASRGLPDDFERVRLVFGDLRPTLHAWVMGEDDIDDPGVRDLVARLDAEALVVAPLVVASSRVGLLAAVGDDDPVNVEAVQSLANLASNALENAELYRLKADFVANVSHELRTPLTVLVGLGETLSRRAGALPRGQLEELASRVEANATRLDAMIATLLDFARLEARERRTHHVEVDLAELATAAVARSEEHLRPRRLELETDPGAVVTGDRIMLEQILDNLLSNIGHHTPPGTTARVEVRRRDDEVEVAVDDDGPGIAPGDAQRITDRFFRGGDHLTRDSGGLGLGLALVRELLVLHGSELEIARSPEGGTRIVFRLPAATGAMLHGVRQRPVG